MSDELLHPSQPDLMTEIKRRLCEQEIKRQIAEMAPITGEAFAREFYRSTAFDCFY